MCNPFKFTLSDGSRDQEYLDKRRARSDAMDEDFDDKPTGHGSYQHSSKLRKITKQFFAGSDLPTLAQQAQRAKDATRAKATKPKDLASLELSKFEASTGLHEWIPTDQISKVIESASKRWMFYFNGMRCPTWLPVLNPKKYHANYQAYAKKIEEAASYAKAGPTCPNFIRASELGLNGHSGGLSVDRAGEGAKPLTTFQSDWHNELRDIFLKHLPADYGGWANSLNGFLADTFLFSRSAEDLPAVPNIGVSPLQVMERILWDLNLSDRDEKNPSELGSPPYGMDRIAVFLHREWNSHYQLLSNTFNTGGHV